MFRLTYRWSFRNLPRILSSCWWDILNGIRNIRRWVPIIWYDQDFDWAYLARVMEAKLEWMAKDAETWITTNNQRDRRQMVVCVTLLRRLMDDDYYSRASQQYGYGRKASLLSMANAKYEQEYLGKLLGKYLRNWWE